MKFLFSVVWFVVYMVAGFFMENVLEVQSPEAYYNVGAVLGVVLIIGLIELG